MSEENIEKRRRGRPKGTTKAAMEERRRAVSEPMATSQDLSNHIETEEEISAADFFMADVFRESNPILGAGGGHIPRLPGTMTLSVPSPSDYSAQMQWALDFRDLKFIKGALLRRRKFIISGFKHLHEDPRVVKLFDKISRDTKFIKTLKTIQWEKDTVGWVVVWPDQINLSPKAVHLLQGNVRIERVFGYDRVFLRIDSKMAEAIKNNPQGFPNYFIEDLKKLRGKFTQEIELRGAYIISAPRAIGEAYPKSPLYPIFEPVKIIENLVETQFAISFAVKQLIMHVKVKGEIDSQGKQKQATRAQLLAVARQVLNGAKTSNIVTDAGVEIAFPSPEKDIFDATKTPYEQAMARIIDNIGIPMLLVSGKADGISYSTAVFIIKGFLQDVIDEREDLLTDFVYPWYEDVAKTLYEANPKKYAFLKGEEDGEWRIPTVQFNETELKNIVELLAMYKFLYDTGALSVESVFEAFQMDHMVEKTRKENQNDEDEYIYKPYEPSQGMAKSKGFDNPLQANIDRDKKSLEIQEKQANNNLEIQKMNIKAKNAQTPGASAPGKGGRPAKLGATPKPNNENRNPRTASASEMSEQEDIMDTNNYGTPELTLDQLIAVMDNEAELERLLTPRLQKFFEKSLGEEDISE